MLAMSLEVDTLQMNITKKNIQHRIKGSNTAALYIYIYIYMCIYIMRERERSSSVSGRC